MKVFVHLDHGRSAMSWAKARNADRALGDYAYGYEHIREFCEVELSQDAEGGLVAGIVRRVSRRLLGFDLQHLLQNYSAMTTADWIWTHTEYEWRGILLLARLGRLRSARVLAQSVWLWEENRIEWSLRGLITRFVLNAAAVHVTLSPVSLLRCRSVVATPAEFVPFGIQPLVTVSSAAPPNVPTDSPLIVSAGNDRDRDWQTLLDAARQRSSWRFRLLTRPPRRLPAMPPNVEIGYERSASQVRALYRSADAVVVPLHHNRHASGITVALEAISVGRPVVATDTGGLKTYLDGWVQFVPPNDTGELLRGLERALSDPTSTHDLAERGLTAEAYARRLLILAHVVLNDTPVSDPLRRSVSALEPLPSDATIRTLVLRTPR